MSAQFIFSSSWLKLCIRPFVWIINSFIFPSVMNFRVGPSASYLLFIVQPGGHMGSPTVCLTHYSTSPTSKKNLIKTRPTFPQCMSLHKRLRTWIKLGWYCEKCDFSSGRGGTEKRDTTAGAAHLLSGSHFKNSTPGLSRKWINDSPGRLWLHSGLAAGMY